MPSGQQLAQEYFEIVQNWIAERNAMQDFQEYERRGAINKTVLSQELGIGKSAFRQNPRIKAALEEAESRWFPKKEKTDEEKAKDNKAKEEALDRSESRLSASRSELSKVLDENAKLRAENSDLKRKLERFEEMQSIISETGQFVC